MIGLLADRVEHPGNRARIADAAQLLGARVVDRPSGHVIAVENAAGARSVYGRKPAREETTLIVGNERRGISQRLLAGADETVVIPAQSRAVNTLNVAAAAAVAAFYVQRGSGPQAQVARPGTRRPALLLVGGGDHVEVGSSLRSAAFFGFDEVLLDDDSWFDGDPSARREARAAARRHKNALRVRRATLDQVAPAYNEITHLYPLATNPPISRLRLAHGQKQLVVVGARSGTVPDLARLTASIAMAEIARQVGRGTRPAGPKTAGPRWGREVATTTPEDVVYLTAEDLLNR